MGQQTNSTRDCIQAPTPSSCSIPACCCNARRPSRLHSSWASGLSEAACLKPGCSRADCRAARSRGAGICWAACWFPGPLRWLPKPVICPAAYVLQLGFERKAFVAFSLFGASLAILFLFLFSGTCTICVRVFLVLLLRNCVTILVLYHWPFSLSNSVE